MTKTQISYDNEGYIISILQGEPAPREPVGVPFLNVEIPQGKQIKITDGIGVDVAVTPHQVILENIPPNETTILNDGLTEATMFISLQQQQLETQQEQLNLQSAAISELTMLVSMQMTGGIE